MQRTNSLNNIPNATPNRTLRRTQSASGLIEGREPLLRPVSSLERDDEVVPINNNYVFNLGAMVRHLDAMGFHNDHIGNILWSTMASNPHILDEDLFNANIEHRGLEGLIRASLVEIPANNIQSISDNSRSYILTSHKPNDNAPAA